MEPTLTDELLRSFQSEATPCAISLPMNIRIIGIIRDFDEDCILVKLRKSCALIYRTAITLITPNPDLSDDTAHNPITLNSKVNRLEPNPRELTCCENAFNGLSRHLRGKTQWPAAQIYYQHALTCGRFPVDAYLNWIESRTTISFDETCRRISDTDALATAINRHKSSTIQLSDSDRRGVILASTLSSGLQTPINHMWHSLRMLCDISSVGSNYADVRKSVARVGPIHNMLDSEGLPVAGLLRARRSSEAEGWLDLGILEFSSGNFTVRGSPSGELVPLLTQADLDVAAQLAFLEATAPVAPTFSLDNAPSHRTDLRLDRKTFKPVWMAATPFGQSMYLADWLMKSFTMRDGLPSLTDPLVSGATVTDWRAPAVMQAVGDIMGSTTLPNGTQAPNSRLEIVVRSVDVSRATYRHHLVRKADQYRLNGIDLFVESSLYGGSGDVRDEEHYRRDDPSTRPGARAAAILANYQHISDLFPVFERVVLLLSVFSMMCQAWRDGIELSDQTKQRIAQRIEGYKADFGSNYPEYELSPKPFHKGGCYCSGGVSGRTTATVSSTQTISFDTRSEPQKLFGGSGGSNNGGLGGDGGGERPQKPLSPEFNHKSMSPLLPEFGRIDVEQTGVRLYGSAVKAIWAVAAEIEAFQNRARELGNDPSRPDKDLYETEGLPAARVEKTYGYFERRQHGADFISISGPLKGMHIDVMCVPQSVIDNGHLDPKEFATSLSRHLQAHDITIVDMRNIPRYVREAIKDISKDDLTKYAGKYSIYE